MTHMLAARQPDHLALAGVEDNPVRLEIERVALRGGLRFIVNVVFDGTGQVVKVVAGDPVAAHRAGVAFARKIFVRAIPERADIVVIDSRPADLDYWQGIKPLAFATRAVKEGGTAILLGDFPDGVCPIYDKDFRTFGRKTRKDLEQAENTGQLQEGVCTEALYLHSAIMERMKVICISGGMSNKQKELLGFYSAKTLGEAMNLALDAKPGETTIGVILQGGDVLPALREKRGSRDE